MRLIPVPDKDGTPTMWVNADHIVNVIPVYRGGVNGIVVDAELKVDGMPLHRVPLGEHFNRDEAEAVFAEWIARLQTS